MLLKQLVSEYGEDFEKIASEMPERSWSQCSQRWTKVLNPQIIKGPWTAEVRFLYRTTQTGHGLCNTHTPTLRKHGA